ncbi:MAG: 2-C-methyl-D-erythritol 4-phosphate cytidylyltransferase, partial [Syntrophaceae bacterium]|nr:2-C-methyl-D-erythritol 4-phosphate cytidylyltransferase [Syntrophaceae bacterium]
MQTTLAIIPAGGAGIRMGGGVAKQYLPLAGIPILARTLQVFQEASCVDAVIVVVPEGDVQEVHREIIARYGLTKVIQLVPGGSERQASVHNALR